MILDFNKEIIVQNKSDRQKLLTEIMSDDNLLRMPAASNWIEVQCFHLVQLVVVQEDLITFNPYMNLKSYR
jgi:hypothetical protein